MTKQILRLCCFLVLLTPVLAWAGPLDDYYLSRLVPQNSSHLLAGVLQVPTQPTRDLTAVRHSARLDWNKLEPATQKTLAYALTPPNLYYEQTYTPVGGHFTIHYATVGNDAPDLTDATGDSVPDWVATVAQVFEHVYQVEVIQMGYNPPPVSTTYDIYLENLASQRAYGYTTDVVPEQPQNSHTSWIEIDKSFTSLVYRYGDGAPPGGYTPETSLQITAAHEFHHAIQYGYNSYFANWFAEVTSTWMEDEVYDDANQLYSYLSTYLSVTPPLSLDAGLGGNTEYGRWIFNRYLAEKRGPSIIKAIWAKYALEPATGSDVPALDVINEVLVKQGSSLSADFFGFAKTLLTRSWTSHLGDVSRIYSTSLAVNGPYPVATSVVAPRPTLGSYTFVYYRYTPLATSGSFKFDFTGKDPNLAVTAYRKNASGSMDEFGYDAASSSITVPDFPQGSELYLVLCNNTGTAVIGSADPSPVASSSGKSGGGCFIATAAYGSYLHPKVGELRAFRDHYLLTNAPGRLFVATYYRVSPPIAGVIARHGWMRAGVRGALTPVVFAVEHPAGALLLVVSLGGMSLWLMRRRGTAGLRSVEVDTGE